LVWYSFPANKSVRLREMDREYSKPSTMRLWILVSMTPQEQERWSCNGLGLEKKSCLHLWQSMSVFIRES